MDELIKLIEKRIEVGQRPWKGDKESYRNKWELYDLEKKIVDAVLEIYKSGELVRR